MAARFKIGDKVRLARASVDGDWRGLSGVFGLSVSQNLPIKGKIVNVSEGRPRQSYTVHVTGLRGLGAGWATSGDDYRWTMWDDMLDPEFEDFLNGIRYRVVMPSYSVLRALDPKMTIADRVATLVGRPADDLDYTTNWSLITGRVKSSGEVFTLMEV